MKEDYIARGFQKIHEDLAFLLNCFRLFLNYNILQRSLIDRTINRFASVSQLFGFAVGTGLAS